MNEQKNILQCNFFWQWLTSKQVPAISSIIKKRFSFDATTINDFWSFSSFQFRFLWPFFPLPPFLTLLPSLQSNSKWWLHWSRRAGDCVCKREGAAFVRSCPQSPSDLLSTTSPTFVKIYPKKVEHKKIWRNPVPGQIVSGACWWRGEQETVFVKEKELAPISFKSLKHHFPHICKNLPKKIKHNLEKIWRKPVPGKILAIVSFHSLILWSNYYDSTIIMIAP